MKSLVHYLSYHNAVPIFFGILFLGAGGALAATPEVQNAVLSSTTEVRSIDNTRLLVADFDIFDFAIQVSSVTEDDVSYFVTYTFHTIQLVDGVWQDVTEERSLTVAKNLLGGKDLGIYVTKELAEVREYEKQKLKETQLAEKGVGPSQKVVATVYSGLVGAMLDPKEEVFPAYARVVPEVTPANVTSVASVQQDVSSGTLSSPGTDTVPPVISMLGGSPVRVGVGDVYTDLGVALTDNVSKNIVLALYYDNAPVTELTVDTSKPGDHGIRYEATDEAGNIAQATRIIMVQASTTTGTTPPSSSTGTSTSVVSTSTPVTAPATEPPSVFPGPTSTEPISDPVSSQEPVLQDQSQDVDPNAGGATATTTDPVQEGQV